MSGGQIAVEEEVGLEFGAPDAMKPIRNGSEEENGAGEEGGVVGVLNVFFGGIIDMHCCFSNAIKPLFFLFSFLPS